MNLYRGIHENSKGVDDQLAASALGMCGLLKTRIGQVYQELDLDFDGSFPYLVEGYIILNNALGPAESGLRGWLYKQINWCLGLLCPIRYDDCDPENPDTWQFRYPESDYLAQIGLAYSTLASKRILGTVGKIHSIYTQTLQGNVKVRDILGNEVPAALEVVVPSFSQDINRIMNIVDQMEELLDKLDRNSEEYRRILDFYKFSVSQVTSIADLLYQHLGRLPDETQRRLREYLPEDPDEDPGKNEN